ncbi:MAG: methyltransferase domain-containing protein [Candidatus Thermoplasmatota archaeon]|nr:methyltransferase domain-containing protein [Candidatus Thermoplasmatota archaeon]MCL5731630.1 methyltransferase domain-containing protein [Candidatus Thermoplasmatota archaeon]
MHIILKGERHSGYYDESTGKAYISGAAIDIGPGRVIVPGDSVKIRGETFVALPADPRFVSDIFERNTQGIQSHDASYMVTISGTGPDSRVLESGIGSGMLSCHILWRLSGGSLTSVERNPEYIRNARSNVGTIMKTDNWITLEGDIRSVPLEGMFDAVFLDMPDPWNALQNVSSHMRPGSSIVTYLPNYNQVESTVDEMGRYGISHIETSEIMKRNLMVRKGYTRPDNRMIGHTGFITLGVKIH